MAAEPAAVREIVARCAGLPLALAVVAARAAAHPGFPLVALAGELARSRGRLTAFESPDPSTDVRAVFSWSYHHLSGDAARLFRLLGWAPGPDVSERAAAGLAGLPPDRTRRLLAELAGCHLVAEHVPGRFALHDLLRAYAVELAGSTDSETARRAAVQRYLDHLLHTAYPAALLLQPERDPIALDPAQPGCVPEAVADHRAALAWFGAELDTLLAAIAYAVDAGFDGHAWRLAWALVDYTLRRGHWHDLVVTQRAGLTAAERAGDRAGRANAHRDLARAYARVHRQADAREHYSAALRLFGEAGDLTGAARTHRALGAMADALHRYEETLHHAEQGLRLYRAAGNLAGTASALNGVGWAYARLGDTGQALAYCQRALALLRRTGDRHGEANTWDSLGYVHHQRGHHAKAVRCFERALAMFREIGDRTDEADTLYRLGETHAAAGRADAARDAWQRAWEIFDELGHACAGRTRARLDGPVARPARRRIHSVRRTTVTARARAR